MKFYRIISTTDLAFIKASKAWNDLYPSPTISVDGLWAMVTDPESYEFLPTATKATGKALFDLRGGPRYDEGTIRVFLRADPANWRLTWPPPGKKI